MKSNAPAGEGAVLDRVRSLRDRGRCIEAESVLLQAISAGMGTTSAYQLLAFIERDLHEPAREAQALEQAVATHVMGAAPLAVARLWRRLGTVRASQGDHAGALAAYGRAAALDAGDSVSRQARVRIQLTLLDFDGARDGCAELAELFPDSAITHLLAGHVHKACGDRNTAVACYLRALEREPTLGEAVYNIVDLDVPDADGALEARAVALAARDDLDAADRINATFAHARILDRRDDFDRAFTSFRTANELARADLKRRGIEYRRSQVEARIDGAIADYTRATFGQLSAAMPIDIVPVFIIGLPRSGTTLVEQIVSSHRNVETIGEVAFARECEDCFRRHRADEDRAGPIDPAHPVDARLLESAREQYADKLFGCGLDADWVIDKLPANFEIAGFLRLMFPQSPILHCVRDPRATCLSLFRANFAAHEPWYHHLDDLAHYHEQYKRLMRHWRKVVERPVVDVVYENLVRDPDSRIPALLEAAGLPFDDACMRFERNDRPIATASLSQVRRPIYTTSIDRWKRYANWLGPLRHLAND